jgi:hypothetical protein
MPGQIPQPGWEGEGRSPRGGDCVSVDGGRWPSSQSVELARGGWLDSRPGPREGGSRERQIASACRGKLVVSRAVRVSRRWVVGSRPSNRVPLGSYIDAWPCEVFLPGSQRHTQATSRPACRSAELLADLRAGLRAAPPSRVRTCVRACASRVQTCMRLCAAGFCDPHPPSPPSDRPSRGWGIQKSGTKLGKVLARRSKIFSLRIRWTRIGKPRRCVEPTTIGW